MSALFTALGIRTAYGKMEAVSGVSIKVPKNAIVSLIGANGAGKTTLLSSMMGLVPCAGHLSFDGRDLTAIPTEERVEIGLCLVSEQRNLFGSLSVEDNLRLGCYRRGRSAFRRSLDEAYVRFPRLRERRRQEASTLSGGERQMLAMARALMAKPSLLLLDEPSLGLAPRIVREVFHILVELRQAGMSLLVVEQNARAALEIADYGYVMELGAVTREGVAADLMADDKLIESFLGGDADVPPCSVLRQA